MTYSEANQPKWADMFSAKFAPISLVLVSGIILHATDSYITATMLPLIVKEIGGSQFYAWNTTLFMLASILMAAITGKILSRIGINKSFFMASLLFMIGCLLAAIAPNMQTLLAGRIIQGAGGGMIFTLCYSMIIFVYPENLWPRAFALLSGTWGIATLFGPAIGGLFAEYNMWRMGFVTLVVLTLVFCIVSFVFIPKYEQEKDDIKIPLAQLFLLGLSILSLSIGNVFEDVTYTYVGLIVSVIFITLLVNMEKKRDIRLFPKGLFTVKSPLFLTFLTTALLVFSINVEFFMPFYLQFLHGVSPIYAGYIAAMVALGWTASEVYSARLTGFKMHVAIGFGPISMTIGLLGLAYLTPRFTESSITLFAFMGVALFMIGVGIGIAWPHLASFALKYTPDDEKNNAAATLSTMQMFAVAFGSAFAGMVANLSGFNDLDKIENVARSSWVMFCVFAVFAFIAIISSQKLIKRQSS